MTDRLDKNQAGLPDAAHLAAREGLAVLGPGFAGTWAACLNPVSTLELRQGTRNDWDLLQDLAKDLPPEGGVYGYISYEAAQGLEPTLRLPPDPQGFPAIWAQKFNMLQELDPTCTDQMPRRLPRKKELIDFVDRHGFESRVVSTKAAITRGDIFQANISRSLEVNFQTDAEIPSTLMSRLCSGGAAPFAAYLPVGEHRQVLSNSPELLLSVDGQNVRVEPIKGTRPRGATVSEDRAIADELLRDRKDRAENIMIADLLRNDLSKVCEDHSIVEEEICALKTLPYLHHLYSRIRGKLREGVGPIDALAACYPCGSITGAPKYRAMEIIAAIEGQGRGPYCGTIFLIRPDGRARFSVAIRTAGLVDRGSEVNLRMNFGGGITILSDPYAEYIETVTKSAPFQAIFS